jgi:hypothetical protein
MSSRFSWVEQLGRFLKAAQAHDEARHGKEGKELNRP